MNWFAFSLFSIIALATAELLQQHLLNADNPIEERTSAVLTFLVQALFTIPIILFSDLRHSFFAVFTPTVFPYMLLVTFIASIGMIFYLRSFKVKNISISTIFVSSSIVVSTTMGIIFFNETLYVYKIFGILLVLTGIYNLNRKNFLIEPNHYFGLLAGLLFGTTYTLDKFIVTNIHPVVYIFWSFTFVSIFGFLAGSKKVITTIRASHFKDYKHILASGLGYFFYNLCTFTAYTVGGEVGRVDAINNSQVFIILLVEYFVFKHTEGISRKIISAILAFSGVVILGFL